MVVFQNKDYNFVPNARLLSVTFARPVLPGRRAFAAPALACL